MALSDVLNALVLNGYSTAEERTIRDVIVRIYTESPSARRALEDWITGVSLVGHDGVRLPENAIRIRGTPVEFRQLEDGESRPIIFNNEDGAARAAWFTGQTDYGLDYIEGRSYIDNFGNAVSYQHLNVIVHELGHAIGGFRDTIDYQENRIGTSGDIAGDTVRFQNVIEAELGVPLRNSYLAQSTELIEGFAYTNGQGIDRSVTSSRGIDMTQAGESRDLLINTGDAGRRLITGQGDDWAYGGAGSDWLIGDRGNDFLDGGADNDTLYGGAGHDTLIGGDGNDSMIGHSGDDTIEGGSGVDRVFAGPGNDTIDAGPGNDWNIFGDWTSWSIRAAGGTDSFWLKTGNGIDQIRDFEDGTDRILLEEGKTFDDLLISQWSTITEIRYNGGLSGDRMMLVGIDREQITEADFTLFPGSGTPPTQPTPPPAPVYQLRFGTDGNDEISTGAGSQKIFGRGGNDKIYAGSGDDFVNAGAGNDWNVFGDASSWDTRGAGGADIFFFAEGNQIDQIRDFEDGIDKIQLANGRGFEDVELSGWANNTLLRFEGGNNADMMILLGVENSQIDAGDFV